MRHRTRADLPRAALVAPLWQRFRARLRAFLGRGRLRAECAACARLGPGVSPELLRVFHAAHETVERYAGLARAAAELELPVREVGKPGIVRAVRIPVAPPGKPIKR